MAGTEHYSLRWNDFQKNLVKCFGELLGDEELSDVTLSAGGQNIRAHRFVLSFGSQYFEELFKRNLCQHPVVILKNVAHQELCQLLRFMYRGEVNVASCDLTSFLQAAEVLQIRGLTEQHGIPDSHVPNDVDMEIDQNIDDGELSYHGEDLMPEVIPELVESPAIQEEMFVITTPRKSVTRRNSKKTNGITKRKSQTKKDRVQHRKNTDNMSEPFLDDHMLSARKSSESAKEGSQKATAVECPVCHRYFANRYNLKVHIRDKHEVPDTGVSLVCNVCNKLMRNLSCLRVHLYQHRKQAEAQELHLPRQASSKPCLAVPMANVSVKKELKRTDRDPQAAHVKVESD